MSVPNQTPYIIYNANGLTTVFTFEFYIINSGDIQVTINGTVITSGYTVSGVGNIGGGDVIFITPPASGSVVMLERVVPTYRLTDYQDNGDLLADTVNKDFDRLWMAIQRYGIHLGLALRRPLFGGPFDAEDYRIEKLADPVNAQDAVTKKYLESISLSRVLRVPEASVGLVPSLDLRRNKLLAFNNSGDPIPVLPESGSASDVLIELAKPTGSSLIGYKYPVDGSVPRTVEDKLGDFVSVLDFGAKGDGVTDDSVAFKKASATGKKVFIPDVSGNGSGCIYKVKNVYIKKPLLFGENIGVEIQPVSAGDEMFYFGDPDQPSTYIINGARIENLTFSCPSASDGEYPIAIRCHQQQQMEVFGCTFYRLTFELIDYRYVTFRKIRGIGSMFYSNRTQPNGVDWADALVISDSFIAYSSRVEVRNSVGFQMRNTYCANPTSTPCLLLGYDDWAKPSHGTCELTDVTIEGVTELNNCNLFVFIVNGHMGAFEGHGLTLKDCFSVNCVNTEFHYSKDFGVYMNACKKSSFTNTRFTNNGEGGIRIGGDTQYVAFAGCLFGEGGIANDGPTQKRGINIEDTSGGIAVLSSVFDGNSEVNIGGDQSKYRVLACQGVPDTVIVSGGGTSQRPSSPKAGQQYYDTNLGLPVWWNATTETWQRADGTNT